MHNTKNTMQALKDFFVNSRSTNKIFVIFVTTKNIENSMFCQMEIGAEWVTKESDHAVVNNNTYLPQYPLDNGDEWITYKYDKENKLFSITKSNAIRIIKKIKLISNHLKIQCKTDEENLVKISELINVEK